MEIVIDGNDGLGKSTLVESLRAMGFQVHDRGAISNMTLRHKSNWWVESQDHRMNILLDAPVDVSRQRLAQAGKDLDEQYHTEEDLCIFRPLFLDAARYVGAVIIDATQSQDAVLQAALKAIKDFRHNTWQKQIVHAAGGIIRAGSYVAKPGVMLLADHEGLTQNAIKLFVELDVDVDNGTANALAEFAARLTYCSFDKDRDPLDSALSAQHYSCLNSSPPVVLFAGHNIETQLELVAHHEFDVARMTSSNTIAMRRPLYSGLNEMTVDEILNAKPYFNTASNYLSANTRHLMQPAAKASIMMMSGGLKDWHKLFIGRLKTHGVEPQVHEVVAMAHAEISKRYTGIQSLDFYLNAENGAKYE